LTDYFTPVFCIFNQLHDVAYIPKAGFDPRRHREYQPAVLKHAAAIEAATGATRICDI
jgi:hypothetical protein